MSKYRLLAGLSVFVLLFAFSTLPVQHVAADNPTPTETVTPTVTETLTATASPTATALANGSITGTVYAADGLTPLEHIFVAVSSNTYSADTCTDASGHFSLSNLPVNVQLQVHASPPWANCNGWTNHVEQYWQGTENSENQTRLTLTVQDPNLANIDFSLNPGGVIAGTTYAANGVTPLGHVAVSLMADNGYQNSVCSDANGLYAFHGAPLNLPLRLRADAYHDSWCNVGSTNYLSEYWQETLEDGPTFLTLTTPSQLQAGVDFALQPFTAQSHKPNLDVWYKDGKVEAFDWPSGTHLKLKIEDPSTLLSPDYSAERYMDGSMAPFKTGTFEIKPGMIVTVSGDYQSAIVRVDNLSITNLDSALDVISGNTAPNNWLWMYYSPGACCRSTVADSSGHWTMDLSVPGPDDEPIVDIAQGSSGAAHAPSGDGRTSVSWSIPYVKANPTTEVVHVYGAAVGTSVTLSIDSPTNGVGEDYTTNTTVAQASWDPNNSADQVAEFNLSGIFDLQVGDVITVTTISNTSTTYTVIALSTVRWFIGLEGGTDPVQIPTEQQVVMAFNLSHPAIELLLEVRPFNQARTTLQSEIDNGNAPDLVGPVGWNKANDFHGHWLDLAPLIASSGYDTTQFAPALVNMYQTDEGQVGLPFAVYPGVVYYQKELFDAAGLHYPPANYGEQYQMPGGAMVEWNYDTLGQIARLLTLDANGKNATQSGFDVNQVVQYGYVPQWQQIQNVSTFWGAGLFYSGTPGNYTATIPSQWDVAWKWNYDGKWGAQPFIPNGTVTFSPEFSYGNFFNSGKVAMGITQSWYLCCISGDAGYHWDLAALPAYNGQVHVRVDADTFRILNTTTHPDAAFSALAYLLDDASVPLLHDYFAMGARTAMQDAWLSDKAAQFPFVTNWDVMKVGFNYPNVPSSESWMPSYQAAQNRLQTFDDVTNNTPNLNMDIEIAQLRSDMEEIFNYGTMLSHTATPIPLPTLTLTPTQTLTPTRTPTRVSTTVSLMSNGAQDGWVLETFENSNAGGTLNAVAPNFNLGDSATKSQYRGILSFNTASLPDNASITAITLKLQKSAILGGGNPVAIFGGLMADVKTGFFGTTALQAADFQTAATASYGPFSPTLVGNTYSINLTSASAKINKLASGGGLTQIRLRFKLDDNNNAVANILSLFSGNAPAANRPQLVIIYSVP